MPPVTACPGPQALQQLLRGQTSDGDAVRLEKHVADCPSCFQQLAALAGEKEIVQAMHDNLTVPQPRNPVLGRLLYKIGRQKVAPLPPSLVNTGEVSLTNAGAPAPDDADESSHFLGPPQGPGELGRLGGYRVLRVLGVGGMGTVYEAEDVTLRRRVALKTMKPAVAAQPGARARFLREARAAAALNHDHVVPIYQVGEERSLPFLAMPLLHGEMLEDRLKRVGRLPLAEALRIGREIAEGLAAAHDHGIIHRDIKPGNVWLERPGDRVKILDFGLASGQEGDVQLTTPGTIMGTPAYMAPEQAGGPIDHRADLFSLGCVLYRAATGRLPFPGSSPMEILRNIAVQAPRSPRELNLEIPAALDQFMLRLLAKEREQRPVSAAVVAKVLKTLEQQLSATIQVLLTPPVALPLEPGAKPAVAPPLAQLVQAGPRAAPAPQIQTTPQNDGKNPGYSLILRVSALQSWARSLNPQQKLLLGGGAAAVLLGVLLLVLLVTLLWPGGSRPTTGQPIAGKEKDKDGHSTGPPVKIVPSPPDLVVDLAAGAPLNANSLVSRPAKLPDLRNWDLITDHVAAIGDPTLSFTNDGRLDVCQSSLYHNFWDFDAGLTPPFNDYYNAISPDGSRLALIQPQSVLIRVKDKPELDYTLGAGGVQWTAWSHGGDYIATFGDKGVCVWDPKLSQKAWTWGDVTTATSNTRSQFVWDPHDQSIVFWMRNLSNVYQIDVASGKTLHTVPVEGLVETVRLHPEGDKVAVLCHNDSKVCVYDLKNPGILHLFHDAAASPPAWSPDGKLLALPVGATIQIWDCTSWDDVKLLRTVEGTKERSSAVAFAPHGKTLFSCDSDNKLRVWEVQTGRLRGTIVFLENGHWLAATAEGDYRASPGAEDAKLFRFKIVDDDGTREPNPKDFAKYRPNHPDLPLQVLR